MKKKSLSFLCGLSLISGGIYAERGALVMPLLPQTVMEYQVLHVSPNGEWACGVINNGTYSGWIWNLKTGVLTELTPVGVPSVAWQVSDNGTVAGTFLDTQASGNGAAVEAAGYWQNGKWYHLSTDGVASNYDEASTAYAISGNGKYLGGQVMINGEYVPVIWENGKMERLANHDNGTKQRAGAVVTVDNSGAAAGWTYYLKEETTVVNRTAAMWNSELNILNPNYTGPFCEARISPDGKYVLSYDCIYNVETKKEIPLKWDSFYSNQLTAVTDEGVAVGFFQRDMGGRFAGCIVQDGTYSDINTYLTEQGADLTGYTIAQVFGVSNDCKTFGTVAYDSEGNPRTVIVKLDEELTQREPAGVDALVLPGAGAVELRWRKPLAGADGVKGYKLYRDDKEIKSLGKDELMYIDTQVGKGSHYYTVKAVYENGESEACDVAEVEIADMIMPAPENAMALQAYVNDVRLFWDAPQSTLPSLQYYKDGDEINGVGWNKYSIECGTRYSAKMLAAYGKNVTLAGVTFYPMSQQDKWTVHVYNADDTKTPLYSEVVDAAKLVYGAKNTLKFKIPFVVPADKDIIIGVEATVSAASVNVLGRISGKKRIGESDLLRRVGVDEEFFSMYEKMISEPDNEMEDNTTWAISALVQAEGIAEKAVKAYKISENGSVIESEVSKTGYLLKNVTDGDHAYTISAVYADGQVSETVEVQVRVIKNMAPYNITDLRVETSGLTAKLVWNAPKNDDASSISWATGNQSGEGLLGADDYNGTYTAAARYSGEILKPYSGYQIKAFRFMPLATAYFYFVLTKNGEEVANYDVPDNAYTIGRWNTIYLEEPLELDPNAEYILSLECFEPEAGKAPLGIDLYMSHANNGDLFKQGNETEYQSLSSSEEYPFTGNWMLGMVVATPEGDDLGVKGYNIRTGNKLSGEKLLNESLVTTNTFEYTFDKEGSYNLRVSPVYDEPVGEQSGETVVAVLSLSGIEAGIVETVQVYPNPASTYVKVDGEVSSVSVYDMAGTRVAVAMGNVVNVSALAEGTYIVSVETSAGACKTKISVVR